MTAVKSTVRTLDIFEAFALKQEPLSLSQLCEHLNVPQSSMSMLIKTLIDRGYLERDRRSKLLYPTLRIQLLGNWMGQRHKRAGRLPGLLRELSIATGETSSLAMRNGIYAQLLLVHRSRDPDRARVESGMLLPLACSAPGWSLMRFDTSEQISAIAWRTRAEVSNAHWRQTAPLAPQKVADTVRAGYAMTDGETVPNASGISILLPSIPGAALMAASVGGARNRVFEKKDLILQELDKLAKSVRMLSPRDA